MWWWRLGYSGFMIADREWCQEMQALNDWQGHTSHLDDCIAASRSWLTLPSMKIAGTPFLEHSFSREVSIMGAGRQGQGAQFPSHGKTESWYCLLKFAKRYWFQRSDLGYNFFSRGIAPYSPSTGKARSRTPPFSARSEPHPGLVGLRTDQSLDLLYSAFEREGFERGYCVAVCGAITSVPNLT